MNICEVILKLINRLILFLILGLLNSIFVLGFFSVISFSQDDQLGGRIKTPIAGQNFPITNKKDYSVSFQPFKLGDVTSFSIIPSVNVLELNYGKKFNLIKHDFNSGKNKIYKYRINGSNRFKAYCYDDNYFYVLSKKIVKRQLHYYLDVVDLNSFDHSIKNKLVIKYTSNRQQNIVLFKKTNESLVLVIEDQTLEDPNNHVELFLFSEKYAVEKYYEEKIPSTSGSVDFGGFYDWGSSYALIYNDKVIMRNEEGIYSTSYVLEFDKKQMELNTFISPPNQVVISSVLLDNNTLVSLTTSTPYVSGYPDAIVISTPYDPEGLIIELPESFRNQLGWFDNKAFDSDLNYHFTPFENQLYLIESYKSYYNRQGFITHVFGPRVLLRLNGYDDIDWSLELNDLNLNEILTSENLACFQTEESFFLLYQTRSGMQLQRLDIEDGSLENLSLNLDDSWRKSTIYKYTFVPKTNSALILLKKSIDYKPFLLSF